MNNLILIITASIINVLIIANCDGTWLWLTFFSLHQLIYVCIFADLKKHHELNKEDDTYTF